LVSLAGENGALLAGLPAEACLLHERRPWGGEILGRVHRGGCDHLLAGTRKRNLRCRYRVLRP